MAKLLGIDVGSTTVKVCVIDEGGKILSSTYERHFSKVKECVLNELKKLGDPDGEYKACITGSAGLGLAQRGEIGFVQRLRAGSAVRLRRNPEILPSGGRRRGIGRRGR